MPFTTRKRYEMPSQSFPILLLSLSLFLFTFTIPTTSAIRIKKINKLSNLSPTNLNQLRTQRHHQAMARFATTATSLIKVEPFANLTNSTNATNGTIDWGDKPEPTDGESKFESEPEREQEMLIENFVNGTNPLKWTYPSTSLLDAAGVTNSSKMSFGFLKPNLNVHPIEGNGLWFKGDAQGSVPIRSRTAYSQGANIRVTLDKSTSGAGPTHFIVLSTNPEFKYKRWSGEQIDGFNLVNEEEENNVQDIDSEIKDLVLAVNSSNSNTTNTSNSNSTSSAAAVSRLNSSTNTTVLGSMNSNTTVGNVTSSNANATGINSNSTNNTMVENQNKKNKTKKKKQAPPTINPKVGKYVVVTWYRNRLIIHTETERRSIECSDPSNYTIQLSVNKMDGRVMVTGCANDNSPLYLQDPESVGTFTAADSFYVYVGADLETPTRVVEHFNNVTNITSSSIEVDRSKINSSLKAIFTSVEITEKLDRFFQCAQRPSNSELQHDFFEDFEAGRLSKRWVVQRPISEEASTQITPAYGFGGATEGESGVAKKIFWFNGDRDYSLRIRRPFSGAIQLKTTLRKEARCSNHWMAISRSKRFMSGVEKRETLFRDEMIRPDMTAWIYPRKQGDKNYGRSNNVNAFGIRLHYGYGISPDRPWSEEEGVQGQVLSNPTNLKKQEEIEAAGPAKTGLWFAGPSGSATFVRTSDMIDRGVDPNGGIVIKMKIDRTHICSNHLIVLSDDPKYEFEWGSEAATKSGAIVLGYNCQEKVMYTPTGQSISVPCVNLGTTEIRIKITKNGIQFEDDLKCPPITLTGESTPVRNTYVYIGASQDTQDHKATSLRVARMKYLQNRTNNVTKDKEDENDVQFGEGPGRYLRSYIRDFSIVRIVVPDQFDPETIVVGWSCNNKIGVSISGNGNKGAIKKSIYCPMKGKHRIALDLIKKPGFVIFRTETEQELKNTPEECDSGLGSLPTPPEDEVDENGNSVNQIPVKSRMCKDIEFPTNFSKRGIYYVFMGAGAYPTSNQPMTRKTVFETVSIDVSTRVAKIDDKEAPMPIRNTELYFSDSFSSENEVTVEKAWKKENVKDHNKIGLDEKTNEKVMIFNDTTLIPVRSRRAFAPPFEMIADILKDKKCNNHFFLVSTRKVADFNFGTPTTGDVVRFAWDCDTLESFALLNDSASKKNEYDEYSTNSSGTSHTNKIQCSQLGRRQITLNVDLEGNLIFSDGVCPSLVVPSPFDLDEELYITIGASPHVSTIQSKIYSFQIYGPPSNTNPITKDNIHDDFTRYGGDPDPDMWTLDLLRGGTVRDNCGSAKEKTTPVPLQLPVTKKALYFGGLNGQRFATTTSFDFSRGGTIEFWMRMGYQKRGDEMLKMQESKDKEDKEDTALQTATTATTTSLLEIEQEMEQEIEIKDQSTTSTSSLTSYVGALGDSKGCAYMYDNDGVVVQYTVDGSPYAADTYQKLWRLPGAYFGKAMRKTWRKIRIKVDKYHNEELMKSPGVVLRWKQLTNPLTTPRGDWGIDMIQITSELPPVMKPVIVKSFCGDLSTKWDVPASLQEPEGYGEDGEEGYGQGGYDENGEPIEGDEEPPPSFQMMTLPEDCRVEFTGKAQGKSLPRAKRMFTVRPGLRITAVVDKTHACSDHMIVLSSNRNYKWNWGSESKTVKFGWNCDHKVMYTAFDAKDVECKKRDVYKLQIDVTPDKVRFKDDGGCQDMEMEFSTSGASEDDPLYLFFGADQDFNSDPTAKESFSSFENFTVSLYPDTGETLMNHTLFKDDFNKNTMETWSLSPPEENVAMEEGDLVYTTAFDRIARNGTMDMYGPSEGARVVRSQKAFTLPFNFSAELNAPSSDESGPEESACPSQFIVVTPRKNYHYSKLGGKSSITVGWDCKSKWIISGTDTTNKVTAPCINDGSKSIQMNVIVRGAMIQFKDTNQCRTLYAPNPIKKKRRPLYLYLGATGGTKLNPARYSKVKLVGRKPVAGLVGDDSTLLLDDYNFRCKEDKTMWDSIVGGRVDHDCGSISGCSLHMGKDGERSVTTKVVDVSHGAELNFGIRFGGGSHKQTMDVHCVGLNPSDSSEFVELQWKTKMVQDDDDQNNDDQNNNDKNNKWSTLSKYTAKDFHNIFTNFSSLTVRIEKDGEVASANQEIMKLMKTKNQNKDADANNNVDTNIDIDSLAEPAPSGIQFRWIQNEKKKNRVCCGHWALDNVQINVLPPISETILKDDMLSISKRLWNAPNKWTDKDAKLVRATPQRKDFIPPAHGVSETGVWFSGDYSGRVPMRTKVNVPYPDIVITTDIHRPKQCSNHFIVLTSNPKFKWEWGSTKSDDAVILAFNCNDKYIYSPTLSTPETGSPNSKCMFTGNMKLNIEITSESILFSDNRCGEVEVSGSPIGLTGPLYVYIGASQDQKGRSSFSNIDIRTRMPLIPIVQEMSDQFVTISKTESMWRTPSQKTMNQAWGMVTTSKSVVEHFKKSKQKELNAKYQLLQADNGLKKAKTAIQKNRNVKIMKDLVKKLNVAIKTQKEANAIFINAEKVHKEAEISKNNFKGNDGGGVWFAYNPHKTLFQNENRLEMRSRGTFPGWATTAMVGVTKDQTCNSHYIVLTTNPDYIFSWGVEGNGEKGVQKIGVQNSFTTVIMGWNCDDKVLYNSLAPRDSPSVPYQSASCSSKTDYTVNINTNMWELSFEDNKCQPMIVKPNPFTSSDQMYMYLGADNDVLNTKSKFNFVNVKVRDTPAPWNLPIVMQDRFDFHNDLDRRIWMLKDVSKSSEFQNSKGSSQGTITTTARVDNLCGDLPTKVIGSPTTALHFGSLIPNVNDVATTLPLNMQYGGQISFLLTFGWDGKTKIHDQENKEDDKDLDDDEDEPPIDLSSCIGFLHANDGMEVQYSIDRGATWTTFQQYTVQQHGYKGLKLFNQFVNVTVEVDYDTAPLAMTDHTMLRFHQLLPSENGAATGHWAIGAFQLTSEPKPVLPNLEKDIVIQDNFELKNVNDHFATERSEWNMFETTGRPKNGVLQFGGTQDSASLTTKTLDMRSEGTTPGITLEIQIKRNVDVNQNEKNQKNQKNEKNDKNEKNEKNQNQLFGAALQFQYTLSDMNGTWVDLMTISDSISSNEKNNIYSYSSDGGKTQEMKSYWSDSVNEYQTYLLQADANNMRFDLDVDSSLFKTAQFRIHQQSGNTTLSTWSIDKVSISVGSQRKGLLAEQLGSGKITRDFCYPTTETVAPYSYEFGTSLSKINSNDKQTMLRFSGPMIGASTVRTRKSFRAPSSINIQAEIDGDCSNHVVVLSTDKYYKYDTEPHPDAIRFVYDCTSKSIIGATKRTSTTGTCPSFDRRVPPPTPNAKSLPKPSNTSLATLRTSFPTLKLKEAEELLMYHNNNPIQTAIKIGDIMQEDLNGIKLNKYIATVRRKLYPPPPPPAKLEYPEPKLFNITISVEHDRVKFIDSLGCDNLEIQFPNGADPILGPNGTVATSKDFYVYIGAIRNEQDKQSTHVMGDGNNNQNDADSQGDASATTIMNRYKGKPLVTSSGFGSITITGPGSVLNLHNGSAACPQMNDCEVDVWGNWSTCSIPCGYGGYYERVREVVRESKLGGDECPALFEREPCETRPCDCVVSEWTNWTRCGDYEGAEKATPCGGGTKRRNRTIELEPLLEHNGTKCPAVEEIEKCPVHGLPCVEEIIPSSAIDSKNLSLTNTVIHANTTRYDTFKKDDSDNWCLPPDFKIFPQSMWTDEEENITDVNNNAMSTKGTDDADDADGTVGTVVVGGGLHFKGSGVDKPATRTRWAVYTNNDLKIEADISKLIEDPTTDAIGCANHFVAISTSRFYTFTWENEPDTIKFVYNCSSKVIIGKENTKQSPQQCYPEPLETMNENDLLSVNKNNNQTNATNATSLAKNNSTYTKNTTSKQKIVATDFLEIDTDDIKEEDPKKDPKEDPKEDSTNNKKQKNKQKNKVTNALPLECTTQMIGKKDLQKFYHPSKWCYDFSGPKGKTLCKRGYVTKLGQQGEHWGKRRIAHCKYNNEDMTCARGEWKDCEQILKTEEEKYQEKLILNPSIDDISIKTTMNIFVGQNNVSFSDDTPCSPSPLLMNNVGFNANEKLYIFIGSAAPFLNYTVTTDTKDNVTKSIVYKNQILPTTASFNRVAIEGELTAVNRLDGTEPALKLTDCQVTPWTPWSNCTAVCEGGMKFRSRNITTDVQDGGSACPLLKQETECNTRTCDCTVSPFTEWTNCSVKCGGGVSIRTRDVILVPLEDGQICPSLNETKKCHEMKCAISGLPFGGEEEEIKVENMEVEIEKDTQVIEQKEVVHLAEKDAQNSDVKKDYYVKEAIEAEKIANDTVNTLDLEEAKSHAKSLRREANEAVEDSASAWNDYEDGDEELDNLREDVRARFEAGKATGVTKVLLNEAVFDELKIKDDHTWCYQKKTTIAPYSYGWSSQEEQEQQEEQQEQQEDQEQEQELSLLNAGNNTNGTNTTDQRSNRNNTAAVKKMSANKHGMWFSGENIDRPTVRSRRSFQLPLRIDAVLDLSYGSNQYIVLTHEKWFTWNSNPTIESEDKTIKISYNGYEKSIVTPTNSYLITCSNGYRSKKDVKKCFSKNPSDVESTQKCSKQLKRKGCKGVFLANRRACQWRLDCPAGVESVWDNSIKSYRCNYEKTILKNIKIQINMNRDGSMLFKDGSNNGCKDVVVPTTKDNTFLKGVDLFMYVGAARTKESHFGGIEGKSRISRIRVSGNGSNINTFNGSKACPMRTDCQVSPWGLWNKCSRVCDGGVHSRSRSVTQEALYGGGGCPELMERDQPCNTQACGTDCQVTEWEPWGKCTRVCSDRAHPLGGTQIRKRSIAMDKYRGSHFGIDSCPALNETRACNTQYCGRDCIVSQWTPWSNCSQICGGGATQRFRNVQHRPEKGSHFGHETCPPVHELKPCNTHDCPRTPKEPTPKLTGKCSKYTDTKLKQRPLFLRKVGNAAAKTDKCSACILEEGCGFCPNSGLCLEGTPNGPTPKWNAEDGSTIPSFTSKEDMEKIFMYEAKCSSWQYAECKTEPCREHADCNTCLSDPYCGWCGMTGRCEEGNQAGSVGEYCPQSWIASPLHSAWNSLGNGGGIGLQPNDPLEQGGENDEDDNDVWLESATQQLSILKKLPEICESDIREGETMIRQKIDEEQSRQKLLRSSRETCLPCNGTWPYCDCEGNQPNGTVPVLKYVHVTRKQDEAIGVDFSLPRKDAISDVWDHGTARKSAGATCQESKECTSDSCVRSRGSIQMCCHEQLRHCSGHGMCVNEGSKCMCDKNWKLDDCSEQIVVPKKIALDANGKKIVDPLDKFGSLLGNLDDESWMN